MTHIRYVPGMPWKLVDGIRVPDMDAIRACPFVTPYTHSQMGARPTLSCTPDSSETQQEFRDECNINIILKRFGATGRLPNLKTNGQFGDFTHVDDYMSALNQVMHAQDSFAELPALLRERFNHDPGQLLAFLGDPKNIDEAIKLGLVNKPQAPSSAPPPAPDANKTI